ncbi:hypothetical protein FHP25_02855 [Vineibacter terrae]|uniref:Alpha/beta hydrolase n=1 Tax=Vineibacter terrae TaxID=2586908 RepID=A0A5C8PVX1_9HYPH|nr:hypothetical protein [Vineibacter terrae]TXL82020.1 hypothetical protein FHP25_02855 [Vineibacter terrae]
MDESDFVGALVPGHPWPRIEVLRHGPFPCPGVEGPDGVFGDARTLLHVTPRFDPARPFVAIAFLHGWCATLTRRIGGHRYHVVESYRLIEQVDAAGLNAVVVAPQLARDADTAIAAMPGHPGGFAVPGAFARYLDEALTQIAQRRGDGVDAYRRAPLLLMSFSGGYRAAAKVLTVGGVADRLIGFIGLDTIYGETDAFAAWFAAHHRHAFIAAVYTGGREHAHASAGVTQALARSLGALGLAGVRVSDTLPRRLRAGVAAFRHVGDPSLHLDLVADGWPRFDRPVRRLLARVAGFGGV